MSHESIQLPETRDAALSDIIRQALVSTDLSMEAYADDVVRIYQARTPAHRRGFDFHRPRPGRDAYATLRANAQLVRRQIDGKVRMSVELEEALVLALPLVFRQRALSDLCARMGLMAAAAPPALHDAASTADRVGRLAQAYGSAVVALAPTMAPGATVDLERASRALDELAACVATLRAALAEPGNVVELRKAGRRAA